jgi:hypothetical protein
LSSSFRRRRWDGSAKRGSNASVSGEIVRPSIARTNELADVERHRCALGHAGRIDGQRVQGVRCGRTHDRLPNVVPDRDRVRC